MKSDLDQFATKRDVYSIVEASENRLTKAINDAFTDLSSIFSDAMQMISERFDKQDVEIAGLRADVNRIDHKLDATIERVDEHENYIRKLKSKTA